MSYGVSVETPCRIKHTESSLIFSARSLCRPDVKEVLYLIRRIFFTVIMKKTLVALAISSALLLTACTAPEIATGDTAASSDAWAKGDVSSTVVLTEYSDFECPACGNAYPAIKQLLATQGDSIRFEYRHFPLTELHKNAEPAAVVAEAAGKQGKFWEMHDKLFENQKAWSAKGADAQSLFTTYAEELGLDMAQFAADKADSTLLDKVRADRLAAIGLRVNSTPTFFLNGVKLKFNSFDELSQLVQNAVAAK